VALEVFIVIPMRLWLFLDLNIKAVNIKFMFNVLLSQIPFGFFCGAS
jgi:hypothetical protein